jgi:hypothetical protein
MTWIEWFEVLSYIVTVVGFPFALIVFIYEKRKELQNEEEELHQRLSDEYVDFLKLVLDNADLQLLRKHSVAPQLTDEQKERKLAIFGILISLFERAYILVYEEKMNKQTKRLWSSWEDYMRDWCRREDFRAVLPELLEGEDEDFSRHIKKMAESEAGKV